MTTDRTHELSAAAHETARLPIPDTNTHELIAELFEALGDLLGEADYAFMYVPKTDEGCRKRFSAAIENAKTVLELHEARGAAG